MSAALGTPTLDATYTLPYVAHATMEVLNCTVNIAFSGATPQSLRDLGADAGGIVRRGDRRGAHRAFPASQITVHTTFLGGGLGRKFEVDYVSQAIQVALAVKRR